MQIRLSYFFNVFLFYQMVRSDFNCDQMTNDSATICKYTLSCFYDESFEEKKGYTRHCRCITKINDAPIPNNFLSSELFNKICSKNHQILRELWINDVELEEIDNAIFEKYTNLKILNLAKNKLKLNILLQARNLEKLDVSENGIKIIEARHFDNLKSLKFVNASFNSLSSVNNCFKNINNLEEIYLNNNKISQIANQQFDHLSALKILNLAHNLLTAIENKLYLPKLIELYLNNNKVSSINSTKNVFQDLGKLKVLNLSNNALKSIERNTFAPSAQLNILDVSSNLLNKIDSKNFQENFRDLVYLNLNNNSLSEKVINCDNLQNMIKLNILQLSFNEISVIYNCTFEKLGQLEKLTLVANRLEKLPPTTFYALTKLQELDMAQNELTELPDGLLDSLKQLEKFNISNNKIGRLNTRIFKNNAKLKTVDIRDNDFVNPVTSLTSCQEIENFIDFFEKNGVALKSCTQNGNCCTKDAKISLTMIIVLIVAGILAGVGLLLIFLKCCKSKKAPVINIIPLNK